MMPEEQHELEAALGACVGAGRLRRKIHGLSLRVAVAARAGWLATHRFARRLRTRSLTRTMSSEVALVKRMGSRRS